MGAYDSRKFSKQFSERTQANLDYIDRTVNADENVIKNRGKFLDQYSEAIDEIKSLITDLRKEVNDIPKTSRKGKDPLKSKLYSIIDKLESKKNTFENELAKSVSIGDMDGDKLYEVTQLLNSLMGIAVLPYEMHKEYFSKEAVIIESEEYGDRKEAFEDNQNRVISCFEHNDLKEWILQKHRDKKWKTTYKNDKIQGVIKEKTVVFNFLRHLRNAVCHSGDNSLSILPLNDGVEIDRVLFYDQNMDNKEEEFAMRLLLPPT